jgi:acetyl-CoA C-acetyltransferase
VEKLTVAGLSRDPARIPVIIGVGQVNDRPGVDSPGLDSLALMHAALAAAERDVGTPISPLMSWLGVVDQISSHDPEIHQHLAAGLPRRPPYVLRTQEASGDSPVLLLNDAANAIGRGEVQIAVAVGAEAMRTASIRSRSMPAVAGATGTDALIEAAKAKATPLALKYGLISPSDVYPLYEHAARAAWQQSFAAARAESAAIWSGLSQTAALNPHAWLQTAYAADFIATPSVDNRIVSFPYTKWMVANSSVNQGAAIVIASLAKAQELGIAADRLVYIGAGAAARENPDYLRRDTYTRSASLNATIEHCLQFNGLTSTQLDHVELYSCFPCIPKMARRRLGWALDRPHSVYGGLTFGGGPIGNCMMHAIACMRDSLLREGTYGLIVANGGYATNSHCIALGARPLPSGGFPQDYNVQAAADADRGAEPRLLESYVGPGRIETYSVPYDRTGRPRFATIIGRTPADERFLAHVQSIDTATLDYLTSEHHEPVGASGRTRLGANDTVTWDTVT